MIPNKQLNAKQTIEVLTFRNFQQLYLTQIYTPFQCFSNSVSITL